MTKVGKAWYWMVARIKTAESSRKDGPPYRPLPPIPEPKVRDKPIYTIVVIGQSGTSHQLELTGFRLRVIAATGAVIVGVLLILVVGWGGFFTGAANRAAKDLGFSSKPLGELGTTNKSESSQTPRDTRGADQSSQGSSESVVAQRAPDPIASGGDAEGSPEQKEGPLQAMKESGKSVQGDLSVPVGVEQSQKDPRGIAGGEPRSKRSTQMETAAPPRTEQSEPVGVVSRAPMVSFNAQEVVASTDSPNGGTLSFRLVKDQPEIRFEGYLFVYVEMEDVSGEIKIYVYPKQTRLGDGDLPFDYKDGESIAFKYNSRVELPYGDTRSGVTLAGVSILLYENNGKIVFQRSFGRREVSMINTKNNKAETPKPRAGEKRQAL